MIEKVLRQGVTLGSFLLLSCQQQPTVSTTKGNAIVECDESLFPVMQFQAEDFHNAYPEASVHVRAVEAREAVVNFLNDSVRVIAIARPFNKEELDFIKGAKIEHQAFKVAMDAAAVIMSIQHRDTTLRITYLDSIYSGTCTRWSAGKRDLIDAYVGDVSSSVDEAFRQQILKGKPFGLTILRIKSSEKLLDEVKKNPNTIGLVGLSWLYGHDQGIRICRLGGGTYQPDTTVAPGQFFSPSQAHVMRKYYPISREVYMYTREPRRDASYGFIAYVKDKKGQQNFVNRGLVPAALPVRMVQTTSEKVHDQ